MVALDYFKLALSKYAQFDGRSRRSEYWYFALVNFLLGIVTGVIDDAMGVELFGAILSLALLIPGISVGVRRLHDIGKSGWWWLIAFTGIGIFVLLYWFCQDSEPGSNEYGSNPKDGSSDDITEHLVDGDLV